MTNPALPFRATCAEACNWLAIQTGSAWTLARLIEQAVTPYVWLDYDAAYPELFGEANGGYAAPIFFEDDTRKLAEGSDTVVISMTKDAYNIVVRLPPPGFVREREALRFLRKDLEQLAARLQREAAPPAPVKAEGARESRDGIGRDDVLAVFAGMVRIDLLQALADGHGIFGDEGARVKGSAKKSKHKALWNPVTLALGLNDMYRVPMSQLRRAFATHEALRAWQPEWQLTLELLGK